MSLDIAKSSVAPIADRLLIDGEWIAPVTGERIALINPATETEIMTVAGAGPAEVERAVAAARRAFDEGPWPRLPPAERAAALRAMFAALVADGEALEACWTAQVGAPVAMAQASTPALCADLRYYADMIEDFAFAEVRPSRGYMSNYAVIKHEPIGVVAAITPWNGPLTSIMIKIAPALAAGCTVIIKPSPEAPMEAFLVAKAAEKAGLPRGVLNLLPAAPAVSELLVDHPGVDKVAFTGSTAAGQRIAARCAQRMARYTMELGGKSAAIILDDAEAGALGPAIAPLVTGLAGQICITFSRILVPRQHHDAFVDSLATAMRATVVGDPFDPSTGMGPLATRAQYEKVRRYIDIGVGEGATLITGGRRPPHLDRGFFVEPTLFADADNRMTIAREEVFGPVATVIPYDGEEEAVRIANDSDFGLSGGVFTPDVERAYAIAQRIRTGHFTHNGRDWDMTNPFGGFKHSGVGREGGPEGLKSFTETKTVFLTALPRALRNAQPEA